MESQGTGEDGEHDGGMAVVGGFDEAVFFIGNKYSERGFEDENNYAGVFESSSKDIVACDGEKSSVGEVECSVVVFINSKSGGRHDPDLGLAILHEYTTRTYTKLTGIVYGLNRYRVPNR
ncbi:hypothetical protein HanIR_Chr11g0517931 [Helianthus annuus]|nr:hypothetical protein HanIR_Chr11g0517931 [Helianthus annuus]KAJ0516755.1 hypothetical protein HanHA89_Chr11g0417341 [Helianthus annuus]KAJ0684757.1 hypothetical protein HanLR1_Chr11g0394731 [Helianthus annuus]